jgi:poly(3-hydroxybutyrate) depolymerase
VANGQVIAGSRTLTTLVWAPEAPGRWPLLVFAHGFQVGPAPYLTLLEAWASAGWVVAAPEFPLTDQSVAGSNLDENDIVNQPADVRFVIDQLVAPTSPLARVIDPSRVAIAGHSDGAETVLAASGVPTPPGEPVIRAVIAMSVSPLPGVTRTTNPPILITQGDADDINPETLGIQTWQAAASPKFLMLLHGGGHLPPLEAGSAWLPALERATETFLDRYVQGSATTAQVLQAADDPPLTTVQAG